MQNAECRIANCELRMSNSRLEDSGYLRLLAWTAIPACTIHETEGYFIDEQPEQGWGVSGKDLAGVWV